MPNQRLRWQARHRAGGARARARRASGHATSGVELENELNKTNSELDRVIRMKRHLADKVKNEPAAASQLVRGWINQRED